jgi:3-hydroxybutyryl-CoA dehydrogenase
MTFEIQTVGVIGVGVMGSGIAEVCALAGFPVVLVKATSGRPGSAIDRVRASIATHTQGRLAASAADAAMARVTATADRDALAGCDVVIEAIVEELVSKRELYADLDGRLAPRAVIATSTSSLHLADLAASIRETRTIGFLVSPASPLVEIESLATTDADVVPAVERFLTRLGKATVHRAGPHRRPRRLATSRAA